MIRKTILCLIFMVWTQTGAMDYSALKIEGEEVLTISYQGYHSSDCYSAHLSNSKILDAERKYDGSIKCVLSCLRVPFHHKKFKQYETKQEYYDLLKTAFWAHDLNKKLFIELPVSEK